MPFKSEAQRKYLWANEPEIARDWTDTYGSGIKAAQGGRIGFQAGTPPGVTGRETRGGYSDRERGQQQAQAKDRRTRDLGPGWQTQVSPTRTSQHDDTPYEALTNVPKNKKPVTTKGDGILQKFKNWQDTYNTTERMKHIRTLNPDQINKLIAAGVIDRTGDVYGTRRLQDIEGIDLSSAENLGKLRDLTGYTGGFNQPDTRGDGIGPLPIIPPLQAAGITTPIDDTPIDDTPSDDLVASGHYKVPDDLILNAAEGGRIGYRGGNMVGAEMEGAEMEGAMIQSQEVLKELYDALIAQGLSPQEAMEKIKEIIASTQTQEPQSPMMAEEFPGQEFGRAPAAFGGIMDTYTGRRKYGFGSIFKAPAKLLKKAVKGVKKLASSPLGKLALMYAAGTYLGGTSAFGGTGWGAQGTPWKKFGAKLLDPTGSQGIGNVFRPSGWSMFQGAPAAVSTAGQPVGVERLMAGGDKILPNVAKSDWSKWILPASIGAGVYTSMAPVAGLDDTTGEWDAEKAKWDKYYADLGGDYSLDEDLRLTSAQGGRIGRQEGGLMNLGGMEKDYRNDGGFVPLGGEEKADDVPARLSRNEFVFTADAVRNAGGGDIDRGAEVMENVMKNLEAGGKVSEESQGKQGAQEMFEVSERLSEVI